MRSLPVAIAALLTTLLVAPSVLADPDADREAAVLFDEGRALLKEGRFAEACPKLERSQALSPSGGTLLNVAVCHERIGRTATAWVEFQQAMTAARVDGKADRERFAQERIDALAPRVPWVRFVVTGAAPAEVTVTVDGATVPTDAFGGQMPLDPGEHRVEATAARRAPWQRRVSLAEGQRETIEIALGPPAAAPRPEPGPDRAGPRRGVERTPGRKWVFELGAFAGLLQGGGAEPEPDFPPMIDLESGATSSCEEINCTYTLGDGDALLLGGSVFAGYRVHERWHIGVRGLGAWRTGGGFAVAFGPAVSARVWGPIWVGTSFVFGAIEERGVGQVLINQPDAHARDVAMTASTGLTVGNGIEIGVALTESERGALFLQVAPVLLIASRNIEVIAPVGLAYRFW